MGRKIKYLVTERDEDEIITELKKEKLTFTVKTTNYTTEIIFATHSYLFSGSNKPNYKLFGTLSQLKSAVKDIRLGESKEGKIKYYDLDIKNFNFKKIDVVFNVDIKAAYATVLKNKGYINTALFNKIMALPKLDRLAIVGMLATRKNIYQIVDGEEIGYTSEFWDKTGEARKIFFEASFEVDKLLSECRFIAGSDFLFYWVDGIYLKTENKIKEISEYLRAQGFYFTENIYTNFEYTKKDNILFISYVNDKQQEKIFNLPTSKKQKIHGDLTSYKPTVDFYEYLFLFLRGKQTVNFNINFSKNYFMKLNLFQIAAPSMFKDINKKTGVTAKIIKVTANRAENVFILSCIDQEGKRIEIDKGELTAPENAKFIEAIEVKIKTEISDIKKIEAVFISVEKMERGYEITTDVYFINLQGEKLSNTITL